MRKVLFLALIILASSVSSTAFAGKKKDKKKADVAQPVQLVTPSDSTSYAAGYAATNGLLPYLINRLHVDTAYIADFVRGYREALDKVNDPSFQAYIAGCSIASQAVEQILPGMSKDLEGTDDSIAAKPFHEGFIAGVRQDTSVYKADAARIRFENKTTFARNERNKVYKKENEDWLASNKTKPGVVTLPSGLQYKVLKEGTGAKPKATDKVEVIYEGKTINGKVFDATANHGGKKTDTFRCDQVIKGWTEALTNMPVGSKWEIYIPQNLGYGSREAGQIKPYSTLIFTVELVGIEEEKPAETTKAKDDGIVIGANDKAAAKKTETKKTVRKKSK